MCSYQNGFSACFSLYCLFIISYTSLIALIRFVNIMGGHIWIESEGLNKGCVVTFTVKLEICNGPNNSSVHQIASRSQSSHGTTDHTGHNPTFRNNNLDLDICQAKDSGPINWSSYNNPTIHVQDRPSKADPADCAKLCQQKVNSDHEMPLYK
ncbi:putative ethylene receptor [Tripterygium wilfordii]|uniref:Putative ethylene receptor n=1 Tax=Tripterygium wilfordii TaxID=458696 RepID=A0A7J7CFG2_TRIWF|nr:putative ethylene receptor [Tripterygium wilfordii]